MSDTLKIGELIKARTEEIGLKPSEFARMIHKTRQNVHNIFKRDTIDTQLLLEISKCLNYDFFTEYSLILRSESELEVSLESESPYLGKDKQVHIHVHLEKVDQLTEDTKGAIIESIKKGLK
ncbi:MAG: hypothetical protein EP346_12980 [Bacteroidetes bacterium]|nr:MAG: hypothetical protein EP346_12980 [Bacteroidota bacterium]